MPQRLGGPLGAGCGQAAAAAAAAASTLERLNHGSGRLRRGSVCHVAGGLCDFERTWAQAHIGPQQRHQRFALPEHDIFW